jgi:ATP-dependent RNA helicase DeaD
MTSFKDLGLRKEVIKAVEDLGFVNPSPIQQQAIPVLMQNKSDLVGLAQTGTGKTAAFGLPLLSKIDTGLNKIQGLIICPTRELCIQIAKDLENFSKYLKGFSVTPVYGGASIENQIKSINKGTHVIVATPGRLIDLINRNRINLSQVEYLILDEADEMLNMGFKEDIDAIIEETPPHKNTWLFSATMPKEVARIASNYMNSPKEVTVGNKNETAKNIEHYYFIVKERQRYEALRRLLDYYPEIYGLIFCQTKRDTQKIADLLMADGYNTGSLHGDLSQAQRDDVMKKFRDKTVQVLVATDVAARGIDVDGITHVINYKVPDDVENYTHRSGRTARAGKHGFSFSLTTPAEVYRIKQIERISGTKFQIQTIPNGEDICQKQLLHMVKEAKETPVNEKMLARFMTEIESELSSLSKEDVIKQFLSLQAERFIRQYAHSGDINIDERDIQKISKSGSRIADRKSGGDRGDYQKLFVNIGERDIESKGAIVRFICDGTSLTGSNLGKIVVRDNFSFVEVDGDRASEVVNALNGTEFDGRTVVVEESSDTSSGDRGRGRSSSGKKDFGSASKKRSSEKSYGGNSRSNSRSNSGGNFGGGRKKRR